MSFPAHNPIEKAYRNDVNKVAQFLQDKHADSFWIYNMSNR